MVSFCKLMYLVKNLEISTPMLLFSQLDQLLEGQMLQLKQDREISILLTDSRKVIVHTQTVFFAIAGERHNGHHYIEALYQQGIRQFMIEEDLPEGLVLPEANIFQVTSTVEALQALATAHRKQFHPTVLAVTGSNGKTIVKEWLAQLLAVQHAVVKSPKSYNSQIGVPLSVWEMNAQHQFGVFEAGISKPDEMEKLQAIIQPKIGIFTNIGTAHDEGFASLEEKINEKLKLFAAVETLIYCKDHSAIAAAVQQKIAAAKRFAWSCKDPAADLYFSIEKQAVGCNIQLKVKKEQDSFKLYFPYKDEASIENILHVLAAWFCLDMPFTDLQKGLDQLEQVSMRMELKKAVNNAYVIDDSYNNDVAGLQIALDFLSQLHQSPKKTLVLSDIQQSGMTEEQLYQYVAAIVKQKQLYRFIGIGKQLKKYQQYFDPSSLFYEDTQTFLKALDEQFFNHEIILVKGARSFHFEQIVKRISEKAHGTRLEVNLDAITHNLNFYRSQLKEETKLMVMVKALAYGSGSHEVANLLQFHRVDYLGVAYADEGVQLRKNGILTPIMVMNISPDDFDHVLQYQLEPEIYHFGILKAFGDYLRAKQRTCRVHLKVDTGMHRLGFEQQEVEQVNQMLKQYPELEIAGVFTHLAGADEAEHNDFSKAQVQQFNQFYEALDLVQAQRPMRYVLNSAGILRFPEYQYDMVRLGIGLYGVEANGELQDQLQNVSTLKTSISQIKAIKKGETIGYSRKGIAHHDMRIATIAIGYADGFPRACGQGRVQVKVNGHLAPIIGNVCMDMCMVDITGIPAKEGDEVIIFDEALTVTQLAKQIHTIPYEIMTNIGGRVKRVFFTL